MLSVTKQFHNVNLLVLRHILKNEEKCAIGFLSIKDELRSDIIGVDSKLIRLET